MLTRRHQAMEMHQGLFDKRGPFNGKAIREEKVGQLATQQGPGN